MTTKFPKIVQWIDEIGLNELHEMHNKYKEDCVGDPDENISFADFAEATYEDAFQNWEDEMSTIKKIDFVEPLCDSDDDILDHSAKIVIDKIIKIGIGDNLVKDIILNEELAPDAESALLIRNRVFNILKAMAIFCKNYQY
jgi:hypothetical protein